MLTKYTSNGGIIINNLQWLAQNGGPAIKLRLMNEGLLEKNTYDVNELAAELLQIEKVNTALSYFDQFKEFRSIPDRELWGLVHNTYENCFEVFMFFFINLGFRAGIAVFDEKVEIMRPVYTYLMKTYPFHGLNIIMLLLRAGYYFDDMEEHIVKRIDDIHKVAVKQEFDFYETDISKIRQANKWKDKVILKDIYNPYVGELPLPISYDVELMLFYSSISRNDNTKRKIDDIMSYILDPRYQKTKGYYGWHWDDTNKTYHATTSGWPLPQYDSDEPKANLLLLEKVSYSPVICNSEWFRKSIDNLENYKTERGTYITDHFDYVSTAKPSSASIFCSAFIDKIVLPTIKRNDRKQLAYELCSTFYVAMLEKRLKK